MSVFDRATTGLTVARVPAWAPITRIVYKRRVLVARSQCFLRPRRRPQHPRRVRSVFRRQPRTKFQLVNICFTGDGDCDLNNNEECDASPHTAVLGIKENGTIPSTVAVVYSSTAATSNIRPIQIYPGRLWSRSDGDRPYF